ncbi:acyl carrier protein [Aurantivibrio plasticivorans]
MNQNVREKVIESFRQLVGNERKSITMDTKFGELGLDSLKLIEIVFDLENHFGTSADEELLAQVESIADLVALFDSSEGAEMQVSGL